MAARAVFGRNLRKASALYHYNIISGNMCPHRLFPTTLQASPFSAGKTDHTYLVAVDGTEWAYNALRRAFECSNGADRVIAVHFPASMERLEVELMIFGPNNLGPEMNKLKSEMEKTKRDTVQQITETATKIRDEYVKEHEGMEGLQFEIKIGDPSPSAKHDIVRACYDFKADSLFLGSKGMAHNWREKVEKTIIDHVGAVPDYCVHNAPCDVMVVKPAEY